MARLAGELAVWRRLVPRGPEASVVHLGNFPNGRAGSGAAGLTRWSMTIRTDGAQQMGDAAVAVRMLGGCELGALHGFNSPLNSTGPPGEILSLSGHRSRRIPNAPFAELVRLSRISIADEMREEYTARLLGD